MIDLYISPEQHYRIPDSVSCQGKVFDVGDCISRGGNSIVYECYERRSGQAFAVKFHTKLDKTRLKRFNLEKDIHKNIKHDHIVEFVDEGEVNGKLFRGNKFIQKKKIPFVIMDRCDETLRDFLENHKGDIPYHDYIAQFRGLTQALGVLHNVAIHRDIKPTNILIKDGVWKLSDFGLCAYTDKDANDDLTGINEKIGPINWMSPESNTIFAGFDANIATQSDVFQLASIFWLVINKRHPTGILSKDDWSGPENLFPPLFKSLQHAPDRRYESGIAFHASIIDAIENAVA